MLKNGVLFFLVFAFGAAAVAVGQGRDSADHLAFGNLAYLRGQYQLAITEYNQVLSEIGGNRSTAHYNIGVCYQHMERLNEAADHYEAAIEMREGRYPVASYALGVTLEGLGRLEEAKQAFQQAIRASGGSNSAATFEIGLISQAQGDLAAAARAYKDAIPASSGRNAASCHNNLGIVLAISGEYSQAEREFMVAVNQSRGKLVEARRNLALCKQLHDSPGLLASLRVSSVRVLPVPEAGV
jgi:tetratricopeptide (TPR) repeat protein